MKLFLQIHNHMTIKIKLFGIIERFNGTNVKQTKHYIKVSNNTYIMKITEGKILDDTSSRHLQLTMSDDNVYNITIESAQSLDK